MAAQTAASEGDTVYIKGGTYELSTDDISKETSVRAIVNNITKDGINYIAYGDERPVFDFTDVLPEGLRVIGFMVSADNCTFNGFDVVGIQITVTGKLTQSTAFRVQDGNNNTFENLSVHDGHAIGWYLTSGSNNVVNNMDVYNNSGIDSYSYGNIDGFGVHPSDSSQTGNVIRNSRAWLNTDDGFDLISAKAVVTLENNWSFYNGYDANFVKRGDGNGFKAGGFGSNGSELPSVIPKHIIKYNLAVANRAAGFYANHHVDGQIWIGNTAIANNNGNYNMLSTLASDNDTDVDGYGHYMRNNLGFNGNNDKEVINLGDETENDIAYNYFNLDVSVDKNDFVSLDEDELMEERQDDGSLPDIEYAHLTSSSDLIDAGIDIGDDYQGTAPDLGAFEYDE
ncbi:DUF4990 domain-containing protein [Vibrio sp. NFV-1]|uniref:DUF4990 domain-containing protein n=2 Tax=Vibrio nitrifigilis TaxID=2789781 RepID=A0ABS0GI47_9VIBR|nr:DUF4990 domain-containing protein [Vibrio nitrifigilis]